MYKIYFVIFITIGYLSCGNPTTEVRDSIINTAHLEHLYHEMVIETDTIGTIWIYCEAPDFVLTPDDDEGFTCVDDVARAMVFYCKQFDAHPSQENADKIISFAKFIKFMQTENGFVYNFMFFDGMINKTHQNSVAIPAFWTWRALWALTELNLLNHQLLEEIQKDTRPLLNDLVSKTYMLCDDKVGFETFDSIQIPECIAKTGGDQIALILVGLSNHYISNPSDSLKQHIKNLGDQLMKVSFGNAKSEPYYAFMSWQNYWHAWGNAQAYAMLYSGQTLNEQNWINAGLQEVDHFYPFLMDYGYLSSFKLIQQADTLKMTEKEQYPQIAYGIRPMMFAVLEAYKITKDQKYLEMATSLACWFFGENPTGKKMYEISTGRAYDGINSAESINTNSGAESTIEALLSLQAILSVPEMEEKVRQCMASGDHKM